MRLLLLFVLMFPAGVAFAGGLPASVETLLPDLEKAKVAFSQGRRNLEILRTNLEPRLLEIDQLKEKEEEDSRWWRRWWLKRKLAGLREDLIKMQREEAGFSKARADLFYLTSAVLEVLNQEAENQLRQIRAGVDHGPGMDTLRDLLELKQDWSDRLALIGFSDEHPFKLVPRPSRAAVSRLYLEDQRKALNARSFQLEAWFQLTQRERRLFQGALLHGVVAKETASQKIDSLVAVERKVRNLLLENEKELAEVEKRLAGTGWKATVP